MSLSGEPLRHELEVDTDEDADTEGVDAEGCGDTNGSDASGGDASDIWYRVGYLAKGLRVRVSV